MARCSKGQYFGELALVTNKPRAASVYAVGDTKCLGMWQHLHVVLSNHNGLSGGPAGTASQHSMFAICAAVKTHFTLTVLKFDTDGSQLIFLQVHLNCYTLLFLFPVIDIQAFERLLGPCMDIMKRNISQYEDQLVALFGSSVDLKH